MITKWKATYTFGHTIEKIEVSRETDSSVFILNRQQGRIRRHAKTTSYERYFDTWADAYRFLTLHGQGLVTKAYANFTEAEKTLKKIRALTKPE